MVRSEVFNLIVKEGEALTYKIMVLPRDDPEVRHLRHQQATREGNAPMANEDEAMENEGGVSNASADTVPVDAQGHVLPEPPALSNQELDQFLATEEGQEYYRQWLSGGMTCTMVRQRSGCGLLAKFFAKKVEEEAEQQMLMEALRAEKAAKNVTENVDGNEGNGSPSTREAGNCGKKKPCNATSTVAAATSWPSSALKPGTEVIQVDSQADSQGSQDVTRTLEDKPAETFLDQISVEENARELAFAVAAGDVMASSPATHADRDVHTCADAGNEPGLGHVDEGHAGSSECGAEPDMVEGTLSSQVVASGVLSIAPSESANGVNGVSEMDGMSGIVDQDGEASATASTPEGQCESNEGASVSARQTNLKHWLL